MHPHEAQRPSRSSPGGERRSPDPRHVLGRLGEELAAAHLERRGFAILDRNARTRHGEIDLIAFNGAVLAFVEVKTRRWGTRHRSDRRRPGSPLSSAASPAEHFPAPLEGLRPRQQARLRRLAAAWLDEHPTRPRVREIRFDAIGVLVDRGGAILRLDHVEGAW
jgi:putative endonuclease